MAYIKQCILLQRQVGVELAAAARRRNEQIAPARMYRLVGLKGKATIIENRANSDFRRTKEMLMERLRVNGCL